MSAAPLPSSTVILLREEPAADGPFSVLLLERHGSIAPGDDAVPGAALPASQRWAPAAEGDAPPEALRYWVTAVRELFEEVGILLAYESGRPVTGPLGASIAALRRRLQAGEPFGRLL